MASLNADTVENVLQMISDYRGETSTNTDAIRIRAVSRQERALADRFKFRLFHIKNQTMSGTGSADYTIGSASYPYRPKGLSELSFGGTTEDKRVPIVDFQQFQDLYNRDNSTRMVYEWYDAANDNWKLHINPAPASTETITYSYFWKPPKRTSTSDTVIAVDLEALARLALSEIYEGEDEDDKAFDQKQIGEQIISQYIGEENSPAVSQLYTMGAIENKGKNRGIGTY